MGSTRRIVAALFVLAVGILPARTAVLIHEYALRGSLIDNLGGPSLTSLGGQISALGYIFVANHGLKLNSPTLSTINYSLEFSFQLTSISGTMKLADLHGGTDSTGLFQSSGKLVFSPGPSAASAGISAGTAVHVVLTRNSATNVVSAYLNGQQAFSFVDTNAAAVIPPPEQVYFFRNDPTNTFTTPATGIANFLRVYNGALTSSEVSALFAAGAPLAVPEPSTIALLLTGLGTAALLRFRRRS